VILECFPSCTTPVFSNLDFVGQLIIQSLFVPYGPGVNIWHWHLSFFIILNSVVVVENSVTTLTSYLPIYFEHVGHHR